MRNFLLAVLIAAAACATDDNGPVTQGEVADEVGNAWCTALGACGLYGPEDVARCIRHNVSHLCELDETCGDEVEESRQELNTCVADIEVHGCYFLQFGSAPDSCLGLLD